MSSLLFSISLVVISTSVAKASTTIVVYYRLTEEVGEGEREREREAILRTVGPTLPGKVQIKLYNLGS
jgi:hypothetical protein